MTCFKYTNVWSKLITKYSLKGLIHVILSVAITEDHDLHDFTA